MREGVLPVAVKMIHRAAFDGERAAEMRKELLHECAVLRMLSTGPNILHFMVRMMRWCNFVHSLQCQCPCCACGVENAHRVQGASKCGLPSAHNEKKHQAAGQRAVFEGMFLGAGRLR